ncbi:MAG: hypothetical protein GC162_01920 [Planctomycetes bacterium]|nr:hypothetical protein [Planctomycetota bacterium]
MLMSEITERIDWEDVKARLAATRENLERIGTVDGKVLDKVYRERARRLAARSDDDEQRANQARPMLRFMVCGQMFAISSAAVVEARSVPVMTIVPAASGDLAGLVGIRGEIWTMRDAAVLLDLTRSESPSRALLLHPMERRMGLLIDNYDRLEMIDPTRLIPMPDHAKPKLQTLGVTEDGVVVLDEIALAGWLGQAALADQATLATEVSSRAIAD